MPHAFAWASPPGNPSRPAIWADPYTSSYAPVVRDIGYLDAIQMWFAGDSALQDSVMYGMPMLWWGRIGKVAAFLGGMTAVLDILGADRIRGYGDTVREYERSGSGLFLKGVGQAAFLILVGLWFAVPAVVRGASAGSPLALWVIAVVIILAVWWAAMASGRSEVFVKVLKGIAWILKHPQSLQWWRASSFVLIVVGFHFDLLAS